MATGLAILVSGAAGLTLRVTAALSQAFSLDSWNSELRPFWLGLAVLGSPAYPRSQVGLGNRELPGSSEAGTLGPVASPGRKLWFERGGRVDTVAGQTGKQRGLCN